MPPNLTTLANVKLYLGIPDADTSQDGVASFMIPAVDKVARKIMQGRVIPVADHTMTFDGEGVTDLVLPHYPINSVASVKIDFNGIFGPDVLIDLESIRWNSEAGVLYRIASWTSTQPWDNAILDVWPSGRQNIQIVWNGGFAEIPEDITLAATMTAAEWVRRAQQLASGQGQGELVTESLVGGRMEQYQSGGSMSALHEAVPKLAYAIFRDYRPPL